jgi:hypothetical protein
VTHIHDCGIVPIIWIGRDMGDNRPHKVAKSGFTLIERHRYNALFGVRVCQLHDQKSESAVKFALRATPPVAGAVPLR